MKKLALFAAAFLVGITGTAQTGNTFSTGESGSRHKRVSPNGQYLIGETSSTIPWGFDNLRGYESFIQDLTTGQLPQWLTAQDEYENMGSFSDVNNDGVVCGVAKDPEALLTLTDLGDTYTLPLNVGALWHKDGTKTILGFGDYKVSDFRYFADGTFAICLSNDAKTVAGYVSIGNYANVIPCGWKFNEGTQKYDFFKYAMPENCVEARINDISGDGSVAVGYCRIYDHDMQACYWPSPDKCVILENVDPVVNVGNFGEIYCISEDGNSIGLTRNGRELERGRRIGGEYNIRSFGRYDGYSKVVVSGITNEGDMVGAFSDSHSGLNRPFYFSSGNDRLVDFDYYLYTVADDILDDIPYDFSHYGYDDAKCSSMSADGKVIVGDAPYGAPWILTTAGNFVYYPTPVDKISGCVTALGEVTVTTSIGKKYFMQYDLKGYVLFRDGKEVKRIGVDELEEGSAEVKLVDSGAGTGNHRYSVACNYYDAATEKEILSYPSEEVAVYMEANFDLPLLDKFDGSIQSQGWHLEKYYGDKEAQMIGCAQYGGLNWSNYLNFLVNQDHPYSYALVSRHMDASDTDNVYLSFARWWGYVNSYDWDLTKDWLSIEVSTNGEDWVSVMDMQYYDGIKPSRWGFENIDLSEYVAGKVFQVRLHAHGDAASKILWKFDNLRVDIAPAHEAAEGFMGVNMETPGEFRLTWKSPLGEYGLNYFGITMWNCIDLTVGSEGNEVIAINKFEREDLKMYVDKYISSISTNFAYYEPYYKNLRAAMVIYENGQLVREQELNNIVYNEYVAYKLDEPLKIKEGSELWVGIKLLEYDADQTPLRYQNTSSYVDGKSNIYSEDNGKTWLNLADYFEQVPGQETEGYASWMITANVTDTPQGNEGIVDLDLYAYEIFKNGERITEHFFDSKQGWFTDKDSKKGDKYQVVGYYLSDGTWTEISEEYANTGQTDVKVVYTDDMDYVINDGTLYINGDAVKATLYNAQGLKLYEGDADSLDMRDFGNGFFVLKLYGKNGDEKTYKFLF